MKELQLYIHIPFCVKKCAYCDFLSGPADDNTIQEYVETLICEIQDAGQKYGKQYQIPSIFIGGGTPSLLTEQQVEAIFTTLYHCFHIETEAEITIEVNPGTVDLGKLIMWKQCGINRLSIGLQSADNQELSYLGRIHTYEEFLETYENARQCGFTNLNVDLISAIPGQTKESWKDTLTKVVALLPEHISAYSLIIEEDTPFYKIYGQSAERQKHLPELPGEAEERMIYKITEDILQSYGFSRYEISNYARPGYPCRHNQGYWRRNEYLGLGLGAASLVQHQRFHNTEDYACYIKGVRDHLEIREDIESLSIEDEMEEFMFLGLRETKGISSRQFQLLFKQSIDTVYGDALKKLEKNDLIYRTEDTIALTERGADVSNVVFVEFMDPIVTKTVNL